MADLRAGSTSSTSKPPHDVVEEDIRATLAAKGYDLVEESHGNSSSSSDSDADFSGRIRSLEPNLAREKGNKAFQQGQYDKAIRCWQGGLKSILSALCAGPHVMRDQSLSELDLTLNLNIAMACMKKGDYLAAERSVDKALARREALPPAQVTKALYRKASAQRAMRRLEECLETLKDLLEVEPGHAAARQMQQEVEREWTKQCREQKKNFRKLFCKLTGEDKEEEERVCQQRAEARKRCAVKWLDGDVCSEAFERGEAQAADGKDWALGLTRTVLWALEQFAVEGSFCLPAEAEHASMWFIGVSSTCELRWLHPSTLLARLPGLKSLELLLVGFQGELDPDNTRVPDPMASSLPETGIKRRIVEGDRQVMLKCIKGTLQEALEQVQPRAPVAAGTTEAARDASEAAADTTEAEAAADTTEAATAAGETDQSATAASGGAGEAGTASAPASEEPQLQVPPSVCYIAHPQLHRYFTEFFPAISWLIEHRVPTAIIGASEPDPSWKQDEVLLKAMGANIVVPKRECPYPMCLPDNATVRKCNHVMGFMGGKVLDRDKLTKVKLELLAQDYTVR